MNNIKQFLKYCVILLLFPTLLQAQQQTSSPYSRLGIGDLETAHNIRARGMGGLGVAMRSSREIHTINPASYTAYDSLSFMFDGSFRSQFLTVENEENKIVDNSSSVTYIALGFPVVKWWRTSLSIYPYSVVGYDVYSVQEGDSIYGDVLSLFDGNGGTNVINWGNGFKINKNLSVGINAQYVFGNINHRVMLAFIDSTDILNTRSTTKTSLSGFNFVLGAQYEHVLDNKNTLIYGITLGNKQGLNAKEDINIETLSGGIDQEIELGNDTIFSIAGAEGKINLPFSLGVGVLWKHNNQSTLGVEFTWEDYSEFEMYGISSGYKDRFSAIVGYEFVPNASSVAGYFSRMQYRIGARYQQQGIRINDVHLSEYVATFGLGLPLLRTRSTINLAFEIGQRGTTDKNLVKETFFNLNVGISLAELWFMKPKYR